MNESIARTLNDIAPNIPKGRSRCFDIGQWGGCGVNCPVFIEGGCSEPQEIEAKWVIDEHGEVDGKEILAKYECFSQSEFMV